MWQELVAVYKRSLKPTDFWVNNYLFRPLASPIVYVLQHTRVTPNQVTFFSLALALLGHLLFATWHSRWGLSVGVFLVLLSFVFDSVDGQLARIRKTASPLGGFLDFLMDEIKAVFLVASLSYRFIQQQWIEGSHNNWALPVSLFGIAVVASGVALTTFIRRPEYSGKDPFDKSEHNNPIPLTPLKKIIFFANFLGRHIVHYPEWIGVPLLIFGRVEWFLIPYLIAHLLYLGKTALMVLMRLA